MTRRRAPEVVVVGAGAVGATLALALAERGREVAVLDARAGPTEPPGAAYADFVLSLNLASSHILDRIDVWSEIAARRVSPYIAMALWDARGGGQTRFDSAEIGEPVLGHFVENRLLEASLHAALVAHPRIDLRWSAEVAALERAGDARRVSLADGASLDAALVVGADGARSRIREGAGIEQRVHDYGQKAIVCNFATERHHGAVARQRFLPGGPVAMLPLADGRCALAWFRPPEEADELLALDDAAFCARLTTATEGALGAVEAADPRFAAPIVRRHALQYVAERVALVGDAAHTIHPLAGQGLNLGLLDAAALAETVGATGDPGEAVRLRRFARWRRGHNVAVMSAMDGFHLGFAFGGAVQAGLRSLGMQLAARAGPVKQAFIRRGSGLVGDLPAMARPLPRP